MWLKAEAEVFQCQCFSSPIVHLMSMMLGVSVVGSPVHHAQHRWAAGLEETPDEKPGENQKSQVQLGRVTPGDGSLDHPRLVLRRDEGEVAQDQIHDKRRDRHGDVEGRE